MLLTINYSQVYGKKKDRSVNQNRQFQPFFPIPKGREGRNRLVSL